jgi:hypothetical protein
LEATVPSAIELIVSAYVQVGDQDALDAMLDHRRKLSADLSARTGYDFSVPRSAIETEMNAIAAGLAALSRTAP